MSHRRPSSRMAARVAAAAVALVVVLAGCAAGESAAPTATTGTTGTSVARSSTAPTTSAAGTSSTTTEATTTTGAPTTTPPPNPAWTPDQQAVADAYQHAMAVFDRVFSAPTPADPELPDVLVDAMLGQTRLDLTNFYDRGEAIRLPLQAQRRQVVTGVSVAADEATVTGCSIDDSIVYKVATGEVLDDEVTTRDFTATMLRTDGTWKLATRQFSNKRVGIFPCV